MAVFFEIAVATEDESAARDIARHLEALDFLHLPASVQQVEGGAWWVSASLRGLGHGVPDDDEAIDCEGPEARRRVERVHEHMRSAPPYRCALCGFEVLDRLREIDSDVVRSRSLKIDGSLCNLTGLIVDEDLFAVLDSPSGYEAFGAGMHWLPWQTATPFGLHMLVSLLEERPRISQVSTDELGWDQVPTNAELVRLDFAAQTIYLHPRRGRWSVTSDASRSPVRFIGALCDALVFATQVPAKLEVHLAPTNCEPLTCGLSDPMAGSPRLRREGLVEWGEFAYSVMDFHIDQLLTAVPEAKTAVLGAISAEAHGPRQIVIAHRD